MFQTSIRMHRSHDPGLYPANRYFKFPAGGCAEAFWRAQLALGKISLYYTRFYFPLIFHVSPKQKSKHADYRLLLLSLLVPSLPALSAWVRAAHRYCFCFARGRRKIDVLINYPDRALARISEQKLLSALLSELVSSNLQVAIIGCNANPWLADICSRLNISIIDPESGNTFSASRVANCVVLLLALMDYTVIKYHLLASLIQVDSTLWKSVSREARRTIFVDRISKSISFKTVILRCEWESYSSQLIDIAQAKGAPTIAFQHGVISHTLDAPCKVDHYMAFGRQSADLLKILSDTFFMATGKHNSTKLANFHPVGSFIDAIDINVNNYSRRTVLILDQYVEQLASFYGLHMGQKCLEKLVLSLSSLKSIRKIIFRPHPYSRSTEFIEKSTTRLGDKFHVSSKGATLQSDIKQSSIAISLFSGAMPVAAASGIPAYLLYHETSYYTADLDCFREGFLADASSLLDKILLITTTEPAYLKERERCMLASSNYIHENRECLINHTFVRDYIISQFKY